MRQGDVGNRHHPGSTGDFTRIAIAITERIKLFDVVQIQTCLRFNPASQATFQTSIMLRLEWTVWQCKLRILVDDEHAWNVVGHRNNDGSYVDDCVDYILSHRAPNLSLSVSVEYCLTHYMLSVSINNILL